jgi:hypothetical protein
MALADLPSEQEAFVSWILIALGTDVPSSLAPHPGETRGVGLDCESSPAYRET